MADMMMPEAPFGASPTDANAHHQNGGWSADPTPPPAPTPLAPPLTPTVSPLLSTYNPDAIWVLGGLIVGLFILAFLARR
jgi:hypothetical protein